MLPLGEGLGGLVPKPCLTLGSPMECSLPGSSIIGIFQHTGVICHFLLQWKIKSKWPVYRQIL